MPAPVEFAWEQGDAVAVENLPVAHGRRAFEGERRVVVTRGELLVEDELESAELLPT